MNYTDTSAGIAKTKNLNSKNNQDTVKSASDMEDPQVRSQTQMSS